jgi:hypothetical protein
MLRPRAGVLPVGLASHSAVLKRIPPMIDIRKLKELVRLMVENDLTPFRR